MMGEKYEVATSDPGEMSGQINSEASTEASSATESARALLRSQRARTRAAGSLSTKHSDKLPRSLMDTPPCTGNKPFSKSASVV